MRGFGVAALLVATFVTHVQTQSVYTTPTTTTSSSSAIASPQAAGAAFPASCPADHNKIVVGANGFAYLILCSSDIYPVEGGAGETSAAVSSTGTWNDCLSFCDTSTFSGFLAGRCTGFVYLGQTNGGTGIGTCYLKGGRTYTNNNGASGNNQIAAIRQADGAYVAVSRTSSLSSTATGPAAFPASCPADDRRTVVTTNGVSYQLLCATDAQARDGGDQLNEAATNSFNDCLLLCDTSASGFSPAGAGRCTGFTYVGADNGAGGGSCYLKSAFNYDTPAAGINFVGALRLAGTASVSPTSAAITTSTRSSTTSSVSSNPTVAFFPPTCPADDRKRVVSPNNSNNYRIFCASDVQNVGATDEAVTGASSSFANCITSCDTTLVGGRQCTGWTYAGANNGAGGGTCYLKNAAEYTVLARGIDLVGGYRIPAVQEVSSSTASSAISTPSSRVNSTGPYSCPANDGQVIVDNGAQYEVRCYYTVNTVPSSSSFITRTPNSRFDDCLPTCSAGSVGTLGETCTGFTFVYNQPYDGLGQCAFRRGSPLVFGTTYNPNAMGLIRVENFQYPTTTTTATTTTTTTTSSSLFPTTTTTTTTLSTTTTSTTTTTTNSSSAGSSVQTLTFTTVSFATVTTTSSYPVTTTAISTQIQTVTSSYPVTTTQISTAAGE